ncbi:MAG: glycosyltransferase family 4 protein [Pseudomonadota bacterium]|nr:glycosyltransferase family 4 protein [Pseudomonadota bacterium]
MTRKKLLVQGWRFVHHSYALVAQSHSLSLLRGGEVDLRFEDLPYHKASWRATKGILDAADEAILSTLRGPETSFVPDVTLRFRPDFSAPRIGRKFTFDTPEFRVLRPAVTQGLRSAADIPESVHVLTPSRWTAMPYERFGIPEERIHVVPLGVDPRIFRPDAERRAAMRNELGIDDRFAFLNVGGMTGNKGIDVLLRAFARTLETAPDACLVLKGADDLYASHDLLQRTFAKLSARDGQAVAGRLIYLGERKPAQWMADLLRAADFYVTPYLAEGFNLPVLEAAACGVPVICTAGGPTDDFTEPSFAWRIRSQLSGLRLPRGQIGEWLKPDEEHLTELMRQAARGRERAREIGAVGAAHVARHYTWDRVTEQLRGVLFPR